MSNILQNVKSGFANMKYTIEIILKSDYNSNNNYDIYINGKDSEISKTAQLLQEVEKEQESKRLSIFDSKTNKSKENSKKKFESKTNVSMNKTSQKKIVSSDIHSLDNIEPEK